MSMYPRTPKLNKYLFAMANPNNSRDSSRSTADTSTSPVSRLNARPHSNARPKFFLPKSAEITKWTNTKLIKEAERLNNIFMKYLTAKEKTKKDLEPIADTLILMHSDMTRRVEKDKRIPVKFPPALEGVTWLSENLAGIAEAISPFSMIHTWSLYKSQKERPKRPKRLVQKYDFKEGEVIKGRVDPKPKRCIIPRTITAKKAADHARKAMDKATRPSGFKGELWYTCILWRMEQHNADMWFLYPIDFYAVGKKESEVMGQFTNFIKNDAFVKMKRKSGRYLLSPKQRRKLSSINKDWAKEIVSKKTDHQVDLECTKYTPVLAKPELDRWWFKELKTRNARSKLIELLKLNWCDNNQILKRLKRFRRQVETSFIKMEGIKQSIPDSGNNPLKPKPPILARKIWSRWDKALDNNNSFLNCMVQYGDKD